MKNFFALILVGGMLLAGCDQFQTGSEQVSKEEAPAVTEQEVPMAADEVVSGEPAVDQEQEEMIEAAGDQELEAPAETAAAQEQGAMAEPAADQEQEAL